MVEDKFIELITKFLDGQMAEYELNTSRAWLKKQVINLRQQGKSLADCVDMQKYGDEENVIRAMFFTEQAKDLEMYRQGGPQPLKGGIRRLNEIRKLLDDGFTPQEVGLLQGETTEGLKVEIIRNATTLKVEELMSSPNFSSWKGFLVFVRRYQEIIELDICAIKERFLGHLLARRESLEELGKTISACEEMGITPPGYREAREWWLIRMAESCCNVKKIGQLKKYLELLEMEYPERSEDIANIAGKGKDIEALLREGPSRKGLSHDYYQRKIDRTDEEQTYRDYDWK